MRRGYKERCAVPGETVLIGKERTILSEAEDNVLVSRQFDSIGQGVDSMLNLEVTNYGINPLGGERYETQVYTSRIIIVELLSPRHRFVAIGLVVVVLHNICLRL